MEQARTQAEFEEFAKEKGHKIENGIVSFGQDGVAAYKFHIEAETAGFDVIRDSNWAGSFGKGDDFSKLPRYWLVRLKSKSEG